MKIKPVKGYTVYLSEEELNLLKTILGSISYNDRLKLGVTSEQWPLTVEMYRTLHREAVLEQAQEKICTDKILKAALAEAASELAAVGGSPYYPLERKEDFPVRWLKSAQEKVLSYEKQNRTT